MAGLSLLCPLPYVEAPFPSHPLMVRSNGHSQGSHVLLNLRRLGLHDDTGETVMTAIAFNSRSQKHPDTTLRTVLDTTMNDTLEPKELDSEDKVALNTPQTV